MEQSAIQTLLDWVAAHPTWAGTIVFLIAFSESLAAVGLLMPGAVLMFGIGALIALGSLEFWSTLAWAIAGAIAGDALSFWLGRRYRQSMARMWPFRRYPALLERGIAYFQLHGGKSVLFGRFVGPIRPIIPAVAGMLDMPPLRFAAVNVSSAVLWAPAYLLPGIAFGTSLDLAAEVATRLAGFLLLTVALAWLTVWGIRRLYALLAPRSDAMLYQLLMWTKAHPVLGKLPAAVLGPRRGEARGLTLFALLLVGSSLVFVWVTSALTDNALLASTDQFVFHTLQELRSPWADALMAAVTGMGDPLVLVAVITAVALWLSGRRHSHALVHWLVATLAPFLMILVLHLATRGERGLPLGDGTYTFPSAHATLSMAVYGFLAVLLAREMRPRWRPILYSMAGLAVGSIAFSRLFLGAHWLSDVLGGLTLGMAWVLLVGMGYRRRYRHLRPRRALGVLVGVLLVAGSVNAISRLPTNLDAYRPQQDAVALSAQLWWTDSWEQAPMLRSDMRASREHPLNLQWAGTLSAIRATLKAHGWRTPDQRPANLLHWLRATADLERLPVLPQVHAGRHEALLLVHPAPQGLLAVRLWPADVRLRADDGQALPLWLGSITLLEVEHPFALSLLRTQPEFGLPLQALHELLQSQLDWATQVVRHETVATRTWDGQVLLVQPETGARTADAPSPDPGPASVPP